MPYCPTLPVPPPANEIKDCDIRNCPCCNAVTRRYAKPSCRQAHAANGSLEAYLLQWKCDVCGCEWLHGQYSVKETRPTVPFVSIRTGGTMTIDGRAFDVLSVSEPVPNPFGKFTIEIMPSFYRPPQ